MTIEENIIFKINTVIVVKKKLTHAPTLLPGETPLYGLYRYVRPQRVWFFNVLVINRVSSLVISVINRVRVLGSGLHSRT